jgi:endoglucanase
MAVPDLLAALLAAPGPSGHEEPAARVFREAAAGFAEVTSDTLGTSFARVRAAREGAPTVAIVGHLDEIGVVVTHVEESGLLSFAQLGGITAESLVAQRVDLATRNGLVPGVIERRYVPPAKRKDEGRLEQADLHIDIGARSREDAEALVHVGDAGVWRGELVELPNGRIVSKALDNRLGAYVALEAARRLADGPPLEVDVVAVGAVLEELGSYGARPAAYALEPLVAIVVDVSPAMDTPGGDATIGGKADLGGGTLIGLGPVLNKRVTDLLTETAEAEGIAHGFEVNTRATHTDADEIHLTRAGVPTALLSIPLRYVHSPTELCSLDDVEATIALIVAFARRLGREQSFLR